MLSSYAVRSGQVAIGLGVNGQFNFIGQQNPNSGGFDAPFSLFGMAAVSGSYFPIDRVEVFGFAGGMARQLPRGSIEVDGLLGAGAGYHFPITDRVTAIGAVGLGGHVGFSTYANAGTNEATTPFGGLGIGRLGMGYMLSRWLQVRAEVEGIATAGIENYANNFNFGVMFNGGARLGVYAYF